ncbi:hypothetical protein [Candidatus Lokiarchaeum ossiferum]|uniref:hypothetical protein n=1 Tax=Candidatus Lokiarchaeum ossiferum TaxID=2951803 RepID=UPI00352D3508
MVEIKDQLSNYIIIALLAIIVIELDGSGFFSFIGYLVLGLFIIIPLISFMKSLTHVPRSEDID